MPPPKSATDADELRAVSFQVSIFVALRHTIIGITVSIHFLTYPRLFLHSKSSCWHVNVLKKKKRNYLGGSKCDFASAAGTAAGVAIMTSVSQTVCEFGFETQLTSGVQLSAGFPLVFAPLSDGFFQELNFVCLPPATTSNSN